MGLKEFAELTWDDLTAWAGEKVVKRGKSYKGSVEDVRVTADGRLLAWVHGTRQYATAVGLSKTGKPASECSCPYGTACKHAVATVLVYLDAVKTGKTVPKAAADDDRFDELAGAGGADDDGEEDLPIAVKPGPSKLDAYLARLPRKKLLALVKEALTESPALRGRLTDQTELAGAGKDVKALVKSARKAIREASAEPGWTRHWSDESSIPDYTPVKKRLEALLKAGHPDEVVTLGKELFDAGQRQLGQSDDEGETACQIAGCMAVVLRALAKSSIPDAAKLLWELELREADDYCCLDGAEGLWEKKRVFKPAVWSDVADALLARLASGSGDGGRDNDAFSRRYRRERIVDRAAEALERAGRKEDVTALLEREAPVVQCYGKLADHLAARGLDGEAETWCRKGFAATLADAPGLAWDLERRLRERAQKKRDRPLVAAYRAVEFFNCPDVRTYQELEKACAPLGLWPSVRERVLVWLEKGGDAPASGKGWPLPDTGLSPAKPDIRRSFPKTGELIEIAILEKRHDDVLAWYAVSKKQGAGRGWSGLGGHDEAVAAAVQETHPDAALDIWHRLADREIARVSPAAYEVAGGFLKKMKSAYAELNRTDEWRGLLDGLRRDHRAKRRLLEVLDKLDGIPSKPLRVIDSRA